MYYTNSTKGSNTALDITLGTIAGIVCLFGLLFLVDRELYYTVVTASKERIIPARLRGDAIQRYGRRICTSILLPMKCCRGQSSSGNNGNSSSNNDLTVVTTMCDDDDDDDDSDTPYGELRETAFSPAHLTEETAVYLAEQQMKLEEEEKRRERQNNIRTNNSMWSSLLPYISSWGSSSSKTTATTTKQRVSTTPIFDESDKKYRGPDAEMVEFNEVIPPPPPPPTTSTTIGNNSNHNIHHHHHDNDATTATELPPGVQKMKSGIQLCIMGAMDTFDEARSRCVPTVCQHNSPTPITTNSASNTTLPKTRLSLPPRRISTSSSRQRPKKKKEMVFPDIAMNGTPKDKYHIECESEEGSIQYKGSSYESDEYTAPW